MDILNIQKRTEQQKNPVKTSSNYLERSQRKQISSSSFNWIWYVEH